LLLELIDKGHGGLIRAGTYILDTFLGCGLKVVNLVSKSFDLAFLCLLLLLDELMEEMGLPKHFIK
jgi:hypothetical protein